MAKKAKATAPGQPTLYVDLTADEEAERVAREAIYLDKRPGFIIAAIKKIAADKILATFPEWKQRNYMARFMELIHKNGQRILADEVEMAQLQALWDWAKSVRAHSDILEAEVNQAVIDGVDVNTIDINAGWPAPL